MPAPLDQEYSVDALIALNTGLLAGLIVEGSSGCGVKIYNDDDVLLTTIEFTDPPGTVNGTTGQLTLTTLGTNTAPPLSDYAAYCEITDAADNVFIRLPAIESTVAVARSLAMNSLYIAVSGSVIITSLTIGE